MNFKKTEIYVCCTGFVYQPLASVFAATMIADEAFSSLAATAIYRCGVTSIAQPPLLVANR